MMTEAKYEEGCGVAKIAYQKSEYKREGYNKVSAGCDEAVFRIGNEKITIGVAGSNDGWDWANNLRFIGTYSRLYGRMPKGFMVNLDRLGHKVLNQISGHQDKPLEIYAHSRGFPVAAGLAIYLNKFGFNIKVLWGWGSPNIGKQSCMDRLHKLDADIQMFENLRDFVPCTPPRMFGYKKPVKPVKVYSKTGHAINSYLHNKPATR